MDSHIDIQNNPTQQVHKQPEQGSQNDKITMTNFYQKTSHPMVALIFVILKLSAILSFIILTFFVDNDAIVMLVIILLGAADFWFTKNITGRLLVGLRWWNQIKKETNQEVWIFESKNENNASAANKATFWTSLYVSTGIWTILFVWELIRFKFIWATVSFILCVLAFTNTYSFLRCSKSQQKFLATQAGNMIINRAQKK